MPAEWRRVEAIVQEALARPVGERAAFVESACRGDTALRRDVESLLAQATAASGFLERPLTERRIGQYEVIGLLGAGGMGEVYRARDTKLDREVALKVLPETFTADPERIARFRREARVLASLNHPNIAAIYGVEDSSGIHALVMELVDGPTLADVIHGARGLPFDEALPIARQIAEALEAAHEQGVIHRDLKPANVKVRDDGTVKVLDFGLAKALGPEGASATADASESPTITAPVTQRGVILGTPAYMSPEQATGKAVDRRADIWAFGCVLYEMLTGRRAFVGQTSTDALASVLKQQPDWSRLPALTPPRIRALVRRCLEKDVKQRLQAIGEARIVIERSVSGDADPGPLATAGPLVAAVPRWRRVLPWASAALMALVALAFGVALVTRRVAPASGTLQVADLDADMGTVRLSIGPRTRVVISPDGSTIVFTAVQTGSDINQLYLRSLDNPRITPLAGTQRAGQPFFSPDSQWVGFVADKQLRKVSLSGGGALKVCDLPKTAKAATWADNGFIYFITQAGTVDRVAEGGGIPQPVPGTDPDKLPYHSIASLPGSRGLLLVANAGSAEYDIDSLSLDTGTSTRLIDGGLAPRYLPTGQLVYVQFSSAQGPGLTGGLLAVPFDLAHLTVTGSPIPVGDRVATGWGFALYDVAATGTLVYFPRGMVNTRLAWVDSTGKVDPLPSQQATGPFANPSISPDGKSVALTKSGDIDLYDLTRDTTQQITHDGSVYNAVFTPDGTQVIYTSSAGGSDESNLWERPADGTGQAKRLTTSKSSQWAVSSVSPKGLVAYTQNGNIYVVPLGGDQKPQPFLQSTSNTSFPMFSPDGGYIAYSTNETRHWEVAVRAFAGLGAKPGKETMISTGEDNYTPVWSRDGKELYYNKGDDLMEVDVATQPTFRAGSPHVVAADLGIYNGLVRDFDVGPDGRVLILQRRQPSKYGSSPLQVVLNFAADVQNRLSGK